MVHGSRVRLLAISRCNPGTPGIWKHHSLRALVEAGRHKAAWREPELFGAASARAREGGVEGKTIALWCAGDAAGARRRCGRAGRHRVSRQAAMARSGQVCGWARPTRRAGVRRACGAARLAWMGCLSKRRCCSTPSDSDAARACPRRVEVALRAEMAHVVLELRVEILCASNARGPQVRPKNEYEQAVERPGDHSDRESRAE